MGSSTSSRKKPETAWGPCWWEEEERKSKSSAQCSTEGASKITRAAHAGDGRVYFGRTNPGKAGAVNSRHHDAYVGGPPRGCGSLPGTGRFRVSAKAD